MSEGKNLNDDIYHIIMKYISNGDKVIIVTSRNEEYKNEVEEFLKKNNININNIYFTNKELKYKTLKKLNVDIHYDNDINEILSIKKETPEIEAIHV